MIPTYLICLVLVLPFMSAADVERVNTRNCWRACGRKGGLCEAANGCGPGGYCCRQFYPDCPAELRDSSERRYHSCYKFKEPKPVQAAETAGETGVCFGAKNDDFGHFVADKDGIFEAITLTHLSGYVSCAGINHRNKPTHWSCGYRRCSEIGTVVATEEGAVVFPTGPKNDDNWQRVKGMNCNSTVLAFSNGVNPMRVKKGDKFKIAYTEDLKNESERDNNGRSCVKVEMIIKPETTA